MTNSQFHDFDLHGIVGIRLVDANKKDVAMITRQVGPIQKELERDPDIIIRFTDTLYPDANVRLLGIDDAGYTDDAFLVLKGQHKSKIRVQIPFEDIGQRTLEIVVQRGLPSVPHLIAIINVIAVSKGVVPLHASAFEYNGKGVLVTGWAKGGKTETLLAFATKGAHYLGDEWIYLPSDGQHMYGIPEPIRLWKWHFDEMPEYWNTVKRADRLKLTTLNSMTQVMDRIRDIKLARRTPPGKLINRAVPILQRQLSVQVPPERLFGTTASANLPPEKLFLVASHESDAFTVEAVAPTEVAKRMVFSLQDERVDFMGYYRKFRFAFPDARNEVIETLEERQRDLLISALAGKDAYVVYHPYPVSIPKLYDTIAPLL